MIQDQKDNTVGEYFKASKILFGAFILGVINFGIVLIVLFFLDMLPLADLEESLTIYFILGSLILLILMSFVGNAVFKSKTEAITPELSLAKKLAVYRESKLIQAVTLEASALCAMVFIMLINHIFFVVIALISLVQMIRVFPKKTEMITTLDPSYSEQHKLNNPDTLLS